MLGGTGARAVCQPSWMNGELTQAVLSGGDMFVTFEGQLQEKGCGERALVLHAAGTSHADQSLRSTVSC